jgi:hypothetical protein
MRVHCLLLFATVVSSAPPTWTELESKTQLRTLLDGKPWLLFIHDGKEALSLPESEDHRGQAAWFVKLSGAWSDVKAGNIAWARQSMAELSFASVNLKKLSDNGKAAPFFDSELFDGHLTSGAIKLFNEGREVGNIPSLVSPAPKHALLRLASGRATWCASHSTDGWP